MPRRRGYPPRARCRRSARRTSTRRPRRPGPRCASSSAIASMLRQYMPIHAGSVRTARGGPPVGSGAERSKTPMLSRPRKPPWNTFRPSASLRLTHQVKFSKQLVEDLLEELAVAPAARASLDLVHAQRRPRVHGRIHVAERPLVRRDLAVRVHVPLAQEQDELRLGEVGSTSASGIVWKARSHAAYHGYSHLSGMEMTSSL